MKILAIESSCDETAAAIIEDGRKILSSVVDTQIAHARAVRRRCAGNRVSAAHGGGRARDRAGAQGCGNGQARCGLRLPRPVRPD